MAVKDGPGGRAHPYKEPITFLLYANLDDQGETSSTGAPLAVYRPAHALLRRAGRYGVKLSPAMMGGKQQASAYATNPEPKKKWSSTLYVVKHGLKPPGQFNQQLQTLEAPGYPFESEQAAQDAFNAKAFVIDITRAEFGDTPVVVFYVPGDYRNDVGLMNITLTCIREE